MQLLLQYRKLRPHFKLFWVVLAIYFISILTLVRANYYYIDDMGRAIAGYAGWEDFSRYLSNFFSKIIHVTPSGLLTDIAPLTQIIACSVLAVSSMLLVYVLNNKISIIPLLASLPLGLSPWFLECLSYRFDSPYMALSIFCQIIPFIFWQKQRRFFISSFICLLAMCMLYQAGSGIYIVIVLAITLLDWIDKKKPNKNVLMTLGMSAAAYLLGWIVFHVIFQDDTPSPYVSTAPFAINELIPGIANNILSYLTIIFSSSAKGWKVLFFLILTVFTVQMLIRTKRNRIATFLVIFVFIGLALTMSMGAYMVLPKPLLAPRAIYGFGAVLAVVCIMSVPTAIISEEKSYEAGSHQASDKAGRKHDKPPLRQPHEIEDRATLPSDKLIYPKLLCALPTLCLVWSFIAFSFMYGNALAEQDRYIEFRNTNLIAELNRLHTSDEMVVVKMNAVVPGYTAVVNNIAKSYPVILSLVPNFTDPAWGWSSRKLSRYYNFPLVIDNSIDDSNFPILVDTYYYTISGVDNFFSIVVKN